MRPRTSWWRENRWWLLALPFAVAVLLGASAYNVKEYWYDGGLHDGSRPAAATRHGHRPLRGRGRRDVAHLPGAAGLVRRDRDLPRTGRAGPTAGGHHRVAGLAGLGGRPGQTLGFCTVSLVDDHGHRYDTEHSSQLDPCTLEGHQGPDDPSPDDERPGARGRGPPAWSTAAVVLVPQGRRITQVRVWWAPPDYVQLSVP